MFNKKTQNFEGMTKEQLKERLHILDYEIASTRNKRQLKMYYKEIESIKKQLRKLREADKNSERRYR